MGFGCRGLLAVAAISIPAYAATYLTVEQAQQTIFPEKNSHRRISCSPTSSARDRAAQRRQRQTQRHKAVEGGQWRLLHRRRSGGQTRIITYAVGLNADGTVQADRNHTYRESYGYEVRNADWRAQFVGKNAAAPLKLNKDIKISAGATLSCRTSPTA